MAKNFALKKAETNSRQVLTLFEESEIEGREDCNLVFEEEHSIERSRAEQEARDAKELDDLDVLCLETACADVLHTFWCEIKTRARDFGVAEMALRAIVESTFLSELDNALCFVEEERRPITRAKFMNILQNAALRQADREKNARSPYRVPKEKWDQLKRKASGRARGPADLIESPASCD
jgi:hypothetical protein